MDMPLETEDELVRHLRRLEAARGRRFIGDDAAVLPAGGPWVTTMDSQIEGVHFLPDLDPVLVARRLLAVNLSDLAAMGARPAYAFLALSTPKAYDRRRFFDAFLDACESSGTILAGGDLSSQERVVAVLTLIGRGEPGGRFVGRDDAVAGHDLWVGGPLGESALGFELLQAGARGAADGSISGLPSLSPAASATAERAVRRHLSPQPQIELGAWLATQGSGAALDVSDGLAKDLHRLCEASAVSAAVERDAFPPPDGWTELQAHSRRSWEELVLGGGEDYVLCFTLPAGKMPPTAFGARRIGRIEAGSGVRLVADGEPDRPVGRSGWDHLAPLKS